MLSEADHGTVSVIIFCPPSVIPMEPRIIEGSCTLSIPSCLNLSSELQTLEI